MRQIRLLIFASIYSIVIFSFQLAIFGTFNSYIIKVMSVALLLSLVTWLFREKST